MIRSLISIETGTEVIAMNEFSVILRKEYHTEMLVKANDRREAEARALEVYAEGDAEWDEPEVIVEDVNEI